MSTAYTVGKDICALVGAAVIVMFTALVIAVARRQAYERRYLKYHAALSRLPEAHQRNGQSWLS